MLLGLPAKGRLHPGCDADLAVLDPEAPAIAREDRAADDWMERGAVVRMLRRGEDAATGQGRWTRGVPVREPQ